MRGGQAPVLMQEWSQEISSLTFHGTVQHTRGYSCKQRLNEWECYHCETMLGDEL